MNSTIAESLSNNVGLEDEAIKYKNYLNNLKRNYLENLTLSAAASPSSASSTNKQQQSASKPSLVKRKITFTPDNDDQSLSLRDNIISKSNKDEDHDQQAVN